MWKVGACDKPCGSGHRINTRIKKIEAKNGGEECSGSSNITETCNDHECPGISILFAINITLISMYKNSWGPKRSYEYLLFISS